MDNARNCAAAGALVEGLYPTIVWTSCVVHTLNLALQNICAAKNIENNQETYALCSWITDVAADASMIKIFIMNHRMRLAIFNQFFSLKLLSIAATRFASIIVMLKRLKLLKRSLSTMVISEQWDSYREDDVEKASLVKMKVLDDLWWDKKNTMIEKVKAAIYKHERIQAQDSSPFYEVVHTILVSRWNKNNTYLHCLAHSLNPRYYSDQWLSEDTSRVPPHRDNEVAKERMKCLKKYFPDIAQRRIVIREFANFASMAGDFADSDSIEQRYELDPKSWWVTYGPSAPTLQKLALKLLVQPSSSSCAERNWSTYSFIHSLRRNKLAPQRAEDLVYIHSNLRLLSRRTPEYSKGETKLWDIGGDNFGTLQDVGDLEIAELSLDEPELESVVFTEEGGGDIPDGEEDEDEEAFMT
ncbi:uncharacterized protein LOC130998313 [Salvia miltiorrhiza]|uniref:uncharacterized protein LOC130998313 n=1 Tax=Salvia miltiorrhiza TaxID=226208 RepID=UPI0025AD58CC|nr:uncharacterized protein LOC130998313 [Salvia miltiorrhiza]